MTDTIHVYDITKLLFENMQPNPSFGSLEKLKTSIIKYDKKRKEIENHENELIMNYKENYEQKRNSINEMYQNYITEREILLDKWKNKNQLDALYDLVKLKFEFEKVDDIYTAFYRPTMDIIKTEDKTAISVEENRENREDRQVDEPLTKNIQIENKNEEKVKKPRKRVKKSDS